MPPLALTGQLVATAVVVAAALAAAWAIGRLAARRAHDPFARHHVRRVVSYGVTIAAIIALLVVWHGFGARASIVIGLAAAGLAFAMQEVVGAIAGWFNILSGRIYRVGDRVEIGTVAGDVIDVTLLRTTILEMGSEYAEGSAWVRGRQYTGRIATLSNKATFTDPVYNYSTAFEYLWEELAVAIPYNEDWQRAEAILREEAQAVSSGEGARAAIDEMTRRYPVPRTEVEPQVYVRMTDSWIELVARFVLPVRTARTVKSELTRRLLVRLEQAGISTAFPTVSVDVPG
jgi:small-conductance mechanosensitive channel